MTSATDIHDAEADRRLPGLRRLLVPLLVVGTLALLMALMLFINLHLLQQSDNADRVGNLSPVLSSPLATTTKAHGATGKATPTTQTATKTTSTNASTPTVTARPVTPAPATSSRGGADNVSDDHGLGSSSGGRDQSEDD